MTQELLYHVRKGGQVRGGKRAKGSGVEMLSRRGAQVCNRRFSRGGSIDFIVASLNNILKPRTQNRGRLFYPLLPFLLDFLFFFLLREHLHI